MAARDWKRVDEGLVKRREMLLDLRILDRWDSELDMMNQGKEGGRFVYPDVFVKLLGYAHLNLQGTEELIRQCCHVKAFFR